MTSRGLIIHHRETGEILRCYEVPPTEDFEPKLPPDHLLWHYLKFEYFQRLVGQRKLWVNRLDNMASDPFDGVLPKDSTARKTALSQIMQDTGVDPGTEDARLTNAEVFRSLSYAHCWTIRCRESALNVGRVLPVSEVGGHPDHL